eukprot:scaffold80530_cov77-Phaeocystis_antarctica.AAC.2
MLSRGTRGCTRGRRIYLATRKPVGGAAGRPDPPRIQWSSHRSTLQAKAKTHGPAEPPAPCDADRCPARPR